MERLETASRHKENYHICWTWRKKRRVTHGCKYVYHCSRSEKFLKILDPGSKRVHTPPTCIYCTLIQCSFPAASFKLSIHQLLTQYPAFRGSLRYLDGVLSGISGKNITPHWTKKTAVHSCTNTFQLSSDVASDREHHQQWTQICFICASQPKTATTATLHINSCHSTSASRICHSVAKFYTGQNLLEGN